VRHARIVDDGLGVLEHTVEHGTAEASLGRLVHAYSRAVFVGLQQ
jgi:hypothetical protein